MRTAARTLMALLALVGTAEAADPDLPPLDPPGHWRKLTRDDKTTTSRCIGRPVTPLCAIETLHACFVRNDKDLCRIANGYEPPDFGVTVEFNETVRYRVVSAWRLRPQNVQPQNLGWDAKGTREIGDIELGVTEIRCTPRCAGEPTRTSIYTLRQFSNFWRVVRIDGERM